MQEPALISVPLLLGWKHNVCWLFSADRPFDLYCFPPSAFFARLLFSSHYPLVLSLCFTSVKHHHVPLWAIIKEDVSSSHSTFVHSNYFVEKNNYILCIFCGLKENIYSCGIKEGKWYFCFSSRACASKQSSLQLWLCLNRSGACAVTTSLQICPVSNCVAN